VMKLEEKEVQIEQLTLKAQTLNALPSQTPASPSNKLVDSILVEKEKINGNGMIESSEILEPVDGTKNK